MTTTIASKTSYAEEDLGNIVSMEHVNVAVTDAATAVLFYIRGMGFTRDPEELQAYTTTWANLGAQQVHLPATRKAQVLRGHIGMVTPSLAALTARLETVKPRLEGTQFAFERRDSYLEVTCPWGNRFHVHEPNASFGGMQRGIPYVEFTVPVGAAGGIAAFYRQAFGAPATVEPCTDGDAALVEVGRNQRLVFQETPGDLAPYDQHHIAIYVNSFSAPYEFLAERGLITEEPRNHQFRFQDIVDPSDGRVLFTIEHEVRGMRHGMYGRALYNRPLE